MCYLLAFSTIFLLAFAEIKGDSTVPNQTVHLNESKLEWKRNYLTLSISVNASCDLTEGSCDSFCCEDTDCEEWQKKAFGCSNLPIVSMKKCDHILSNFDCDCGSNEKPEWFPLLCSEYGNPIYLGKFHEIPKTIENIPRFYSEIKKKNHNLFAYKEKLFKETDHRKVNNHYRHRSPIKTFSPGVEPYKFPVIGTLMSKVGTLNSHQACESVSEKFRINNFASCLTRISREHCENGQLLGISSHLIQDGTTASHSLSPFILKSLHYLKGSKASNKITCTSSRMHSVKYGQKNVFIIVEHKEKSCGDQVDAYKTHWQNENCFNVLLGINRQFLVNGSDISNIVTEYRIANIQLPHNFNMNYIENNSIFIKQTFNTTFTDMSESEKSHNMYHGHPSLNIRGYFMGEQLIFGYKSSYNTSEWERGTLAVFQNGGSCDRTRPITFGFDYISRCHIPEKFPTCEHLRNYTEEKLNKLIRGDALAPYSRFSNFSEEGVPLLRNYLPLNGSKSSRESVCLIHLVQDILVLYTKVTTEKGRLVNKIKGLKVDRVPRNVSLEKFKGFLTSRVVFSFLSSEKVSARSRFWEKALSPELSENAWLNLLNAFDGDGEEENSFWCIVLAVGILSSFAVTKLNVDYGEFY